MQFISIDPSLANMGIVKGSINIVGGKTLIELDSYELITTKKSQVKTIRASSDTIDRCAYLHKNLTRVIEEFQPDVCFAETPSGSQSYSGALSFAISCFLISLCNPPAIQVTPTEVKKFTVGSKTASKKEIINYIGEKYPGFLKKKKDGSYLEGEMEHIADAVCIVEAGIQTNQFKQISKFINN